ncbi:MAG: NADP-dependent oxidoreductase, partial [Trebonia sp.]
FEQAAVVPVSAITALQALTGAGRVRPADKVLITGASGGVGSYAVQLAAILGGTVTATGVARQRDFVLGLGATTFLAPGAGNTAGYKAVAPDGFDVVIDTIGGAVLDASYELTRRGGRLVTLSAPPSADKAAALGVHAMFFVVTPDAAELAKLAGLVDEGRLRPVVSQVFPLRDGRQAFESATKPHPPGKTVLTVP